MNALGGSDTAHPGAAVLPARAAGTSPHPASNLAPGSNAGGSFRKRHHTPEGLARLRELARLAMQNPEIVARMRAGMEAKNPWPARLDELRQLVASGASLSAIARRFGCNRKTLKFRCEQYGIDAKSVRNFQMAAGEEVLREIYYRADLGSADLIAQYRVARPKATLDALHQHARRLGLRRPDDRQQVGAMAGCNGRVVAMALQRTAMAAQVQGWLDDGLLCQHIVNTRGVSHERLRRMQREGLITIPPRPKAAPYVRPSRAKAVVAVAPLHSPAPPRFVPIPVPTPVVHTPLPEPVEVISFPAPSLNGKIYAGFNAIRQWAQRAGFDYDGSNMERVNRVRAAANLPLLVQDEAT